MIDSHFFKCRHCGKIFKKNKRVKNQHFCGAKMCQKARKKLWQRQKLKTDPDYKLNQKDCQKEWREKNKDYFKKYRKENPKYTANNRLHQRKRDAIKRLAKMDAIKTISPLKQGIYFISSQNPSLAKMDASAQKVCIIPIC